MIKEVTHPLVKHKLSVLRDKETSHKKFRELADELTMFLAYEALKTVEIGEKEIETPITKTLGFELKNEIIIVPILRAGVGMLNGMFNLVPTARVGFVGMYRDPKTKEPVEYYKKFPENIENPIIFIVDPMLATGGSIIATVDLLKKEGFDKINIISIIASPEGVELLQKHHPDVDLYTAGVDEYLNENKYIVPGLGDAGDRLYGTK